MISEDEKSDSFIIAEGYNFYQVNKNEFEKIISRDKLIDIKTIKDNPICTIIMITTIVLSLLLYFYEEEFVLINSDLVLATILLIMNILLHEVGHVFCMKLFYKESKVKVGFKFVFIYPAFYVDTSYSYLLPKYKRIAIYMAGNFVNCIFLLLIMLIFPGLIPYCYLIVSNILINFVPIIKSDGYYALITLLNKNNRCKTIKKEICDDYIRGILMFIFLSIVSFISNRWKI